MIKEILSDNRNVVVPFPASTAVARGNLLFWDNSAKVAKNASARTDKGALIANQRDFAMNFLGVCQDQRLAAETSTGRDSWRNIVLDGIFDCDCASTTWEYGDLVAVDRNSGTPANYDAQVAKVSNPALAIGNVIQRGTSLTTVRCRLTSNLLWTIPENANAGVGGMQGQGVTALADSAVTLTLDQGPYLNMTPTTARNVTLPLEALSIGLMFYFTNLAAGASTVTFLASGGGSIKGNGAVPQNKSGIFWCDGTNWTGLVSA